jgi:hypothetical protein
MSIEEIVDILATGDIEQLFAQVLDDAFMDSVMVRIREKAFAQAVDNVSFFAKDLGVSFGTLNPEVIESIRALDLKMARTLKADVHDAVREVAEEGLRLGINPRQMARDMRQSVGLTGKQVEWVNNFRSELENNSKAALNRSLGRGFFKKPDGSMGFREAHAGGAGLGKRDMATLRRTLGTDQKLSTAQIDRMVEAYRKRLTAWHAESIARTATLDSLKNANRQATKQAVKDGILDANRMMKQRVSAGDSRVREGHVAIDGQRRRMDERYSNGEMVSGDLSYACRCVDRYYQARKVAQWAATPAG